MKSMKLLFLFVLTYSSIHAINPNLESSAVQKLQQNEVKNILDEALDIKENQIVKHMKADDKIIILDQDFNKIREENVASAEKLSNQSMLVPIIYRSEFITKVYNVSYYMLKKNN